MTDKELIETLKKAQEAQDNIALQMLLAMAAERIGVLSNAQEKR